MRTVLKGRKINSALFNPRASNKLLGGAVGVCLCVPGYIGMELYTFSVDGHQERDLTRTMYHTCVPTDLRVPLFSSFLVSKDTSRAPIFKWFFPSVYVYISCSNKPDLYRLVPFDGTFGLESPADSVSRKCSSPGMASNERERERERERESPPPPSYQDAKKSPKQDCEGEKERGRRKCNFSLFRAQQGKKKASNAPARTRVWACSE